MYPAAGWRTGCRQSMCLVRAEARVSPELVVWVAPPRAGVRCTDPRVRPLHWADARASLTDTDGIPLAALGLDEVELTQPALDVGSDGPG
jgi:hypothetical protein